VPAAARMLARATLLRPLRESYRMGMPTLPTTGWTVDMLETLPDDGKRYEIIDGELLVTPAPDLAHQVVAGELYARVREYLRAHPVGRAVMAPADVRVGDRTSVEPDVFVIPQVKGPFARAWSPLSTLLLAVEVLSATTARVDRGRKLALYQREGVREYWIVDVDSRLVERWRPGDERPEILRETLEWRVEGAAEPLVIDLPALFAEALGE
jgi:Uma2 family endonuclease